jgi:hypothetical protein
MPSKAASPDFTEENGTPYAMSPGSLLPAVVIRCPRMASIEMRPCLTSTCDRIVVSTSHVIVLGMSVRGRDGETLCKG